MGTILTDYDYPAFEQGQRTRAWARQYIAERALAATRKIRPPEEAGVTGVAPVDMSDWKPDVSGNPAESFDWRQYRAVVEARRRDG